MVNTLMDTLDNYFLTLNEEEFIALAKVVVEKIACKLNKENKKELLNKLIGNFRSFASENYTELHSTLQYIKAVDDRNMVLNKYLHRLTKKEVSSFEDRYSLPLYMEESEIYRRGVIDGITKYRFLEELIENEM